MSGAHALALAGKTVVITGAAGAYGRELASAFHAEGARLVLSDRLARLDSSLPDDSFHYLPADLSDRRDLERLADALIAEGAPDVLINNAALFPFTDLLDISPESAEALLAVNLRAPLRLMQRVGAAMAQRGHGAIINISSGAASVVRDNGALYGASKAALEHLTRAFAVRLGPSGVRVNAVRPGLRGDSLAGIPADHMARVGAGVPLRRLARDGEVAAAVMFLCSDAAAFVTGETIAVDGGNGINRRMTAP
jgi:3-oxoacyl-[acyl-carrier protein] reductase